MEKGIFSLEEWQLEALIGENESGIPSPKEAGERGNDQEDRK